AVVLDAVELDTQLGVIVRVVDDFLFRLKGLLGRSRIGDRRFHRRGRLVLTGRGGPQRNEDQQRRKAEYSTQRHVRRPSIKDRKSKISIPCRPETVTLSSAYKINRCRSGLPA